MSDETTDRPLETVWGYIPAQDDTKLTGAKLSRPMLLEMFKVRWEELLEQSFALSVKGLFAEQVFALCLHAGAEVTGCIREHSGRMELRLEPCSIAAAQDGLFHVAYGKQNGWRLMLVGFDRTRCQVVCTQVLPTPETRPATLPASTPAATDEHPASPKSYAGAGEPARTATESEPVYYV
jgi:hypothetical protein